MYVKARYSDYSTYQLNMQQPMQVYVLQQFKSSCTCCYTYVLQMQMYM